VFSNVSSANDCWLNFSTVLNDCFTLYVPSKIATVVHINVSKGNKILHPKNVSKLYVKKNINGGNSKLALLQRTRLNINVAFN
jgi:hypothetical protein